MQGFFLLWRCLRIVSYSRVREVVVGFAVCLLGSGVFGIRLGEAGGDDLRVGWVGFQVHGWEVVAGEIAEGGVGRALGSFFAVGVVGDGEVGVVLRIERSDGM